MTKKEWALSLAGDGFFIFPIKPLDKTPAVTKWQEAATRDTGRIGRWWDINPEYNIGIYTGKFGDDGGALLVVDVDVKEGKNGYEELLRLELEGWEMPQTRCHVTPSTGRHYLYRVDAPVRQGANVLAPGLDVRSRGGYVVGPGSTLVHGVYTLDGPLSRPVDAPQWLIDRCGTDTRRKSGVRHDAVAVNPDHANRRAEWYLEHDAPPAIQGQGGDQTTFCVAAKLKDMGVLEATATMLMWDLWNPRCEPPWEPNELEKKVHNAYRYSENPPGIDSPEAAFVNVPIEDTEAEQKTLHPYDKLNKDHAFVIAGGGAHILWETSDQHDKGTVEHLDIGAFKLKFAPIKMKVGKTETSIASQWLEWKGRRAYDGIVFSPGQHKEVTTGLNGSRKTYFNLWRGFSYPPAPIGSSHRALDLFLEHTRLNVCGGNELLSRWLLGYFAHLVQRPYEKPLVALVFRGGKGVGKNACIERIGALLGRHFLLTSNRRYLVGNFNGHLENCLMFALDEAFWSGDKQAEGTLKDLITGRDHVIEHKGKEPYTVANKTRVVIIGNEDWIVPVSHDERRFAFFDVGDGRKQDRAFFQTMREEMEQGGYPVLLRYLLDYPLSGLDFNEAPATEGLADQKIHSLNPMYQWWHKCLTDGRIIGAEFEGWPTTVDCERLRLAFMRYNKDRRVTLWMHEDLKMGKPLKHSTPSIKRVRAGEGDAQAYVYIMPTLDVCRAEWAVFINHQTEWEGL